MEILVIIVAFIVGNLLVTVYLSSDFRWRLEFALEDICKRFRGLKSTFAKKFFREKNRD
jgi:hypothetical protein